ncbi:DUF5719 family protein [Subtercola lobariae]|uniref:Large extracellular alpha-helical protein n=1 Tax=Subtercola lobariae TaxID=1588641 RepID=A0A917B1B0_9MICO|nr:DUF5719 family protein [Subtercola lobariae]GGF14308.1 hypothetical protein GCM10011399_05190 [Subtercola lobariae]
MQSEFDENSAAETNPESLTPNSVPAEVATGDAPPTAAEAQAGPAELGNAVSGETAPTAAEAEPGVLAANAGQPDDSANAGGTAKPTKAPKPAKPAKPAKAAKPVKEPKAARPARAPRPAKERATSGVGSGAAGRSAARTGLRIATSVVVLALGAATVGAAAVLSLPTVASGVPSVLVTPAASDQTRACPGPYVGPADPGAASSDNAAPSLVSLGTPTVIGGIAPSSTQFTIGSLSTPDAATGPSHPLTLTAPGANGTLLGGSQSQQITQSDLVGLSSSECSEASADSWIAAGSTVTGRSAYLVLSNPTSVLSTVSLAIFDETGVVNAPGTSGITVQPHSQRALSLAGFAPSVVSPVIHVTAAGGTVLASLQQSVIRGLTPGGIDVAGPTGAPALTQTIAGVQIISTSAIAEQAADPASSDLPAALRVYVPGAAGATLTVTLKSETLGVADVTASYSAAGGVVTDFPFPSLTDDSYSVIVSSDQPVVVGARSAVVSGGTDFAWYQSSRAIGGTFMFVTATGPNPRLQLVNTTNTDAAVTVTPTTGDTTPITFTVAANSAAGQPVAANTPYTVVTSAPLTASVGYLGDGLISAFSVSPASPLAAPITIYGGTGE